MTFRQVAHPLVGTERVFIPPTAPARGTTLPEAGDIGKSILVLSVGDRVTVESAWTRDYLPPTAPTLLYVRSHSTGLSTHVVEVDLVDPS